MGFPILETQIQFERGPYDGDAGATTFTTVKPLTITTSIGRTAEAEATQPGAATLTLDNHLREFDPTHTTGPHYGQLLPARQVRVKATWPLVAGTDYYPFVGWVESWPQTYQAPAAADIDIPCVDALGLAALAKLPPSVYAAAVADDQPLAWWRLDEGAGTVMADATGNRRDGEYVGGATFNHRDGLIDGDDNQAIGFDPRTQFARAPHLDLSPWPTPITSTSSDAEGLIYEIWQQGKILQDAATLPNSYPFMLAGRAGRELLWIGWSQNRKLRVGVYPHGTLYEYKVNASATKRHHVVVSVESGVTTLGYSEEEDSAVWLGDLKVASAMAAGPLTPTYLIGASYTGGEPFGTWTRGGVIIGYSEEEDSAVWLGELVVATADVATSPILNNADYTGGSPIGTWTTSFNLHVWVDGEELDGVGVEIGTTDRSVLGVHLASIIRLFPDGDSPDLILDEAAVYPASADIEAIAEGHWAAGTAPWTGDGTIDRLAHILGLLKLAGLEDANVYPDTHRATELGSATLGDDAVAYLQRLEVTEAGRLVTNFSLGDGPRLQLQPRIPQLPTLAYTFTDEDLPDALHYTGLKLDAGESFIVNEVTVKWGGDPDNAAGEITLRDQDSIDLFGIRHRDIATLHAGPAEAQAFGEYVLARDAKPRTRITELRVKATGDDRLWPVVLGAQRGDRVQVKHKPQNIGARITVDATIEGISHTVQSGVSVWETTFFLAALDTHDDGSLAGWWTWGTSAWGDDDMRWYL